MTPFNMFIYIIHLKNKKATDFVYFVSKTVVEHLFFTSSHQHIIAFCMRIDYNGFIKQKGILL